MYVGMPGWTTTVEKRMTCRTKKGLYEGVVTSTKNANSGGAIKTGLFGS
jgi:hypothetical protein